MINSAKQAASSTAVRRYAGHLPVLGSGGTSETILALRRDNGRSLVMSWALNAADVALRSTRSAYPEPFAERMSGRHKRQLGDQFGLRNFGVNLTMLEPGAVSALQHRHSRQDEFIYVLDGELTLVSGTDEQVVAAGMCIGFPAGGDSHHLENRSHASATFLEIGDRTEGDQVSYPFDDLVASREGNGWRFTHKNGEPY